MLDMSSFARDIIDRLHHTASYFPEEQAVRLAADLRSIANIDWSQGKDLWVARKRDLVLAYGYQPTQQTDEKPFAFAGGLAFIPVHGMLLNRFSGSYSFATGYNFIRSQMFAAQADPDVQGIVFDYNTYGGTAAGCGELSKDMFDSRDAKPTLGVIDHSCYSAGYFLGSANHELVGSPSSGCGSIGCVSMHVDMSEMLKQDGIKITFIKSGDEKTDGNPYEPLSKTARKTIQSSVDYHASAFFEAVSRNRGIDESEIRAFQARCFDPPGAIENGLIDAVQTPSEAVSSFLNSLNGGSTAMQTNQGGNGTGAAAPAPMTVEQITAAVAAGIASALPTAIAAHDKAKTERRAAIMGCDEAKDRQKLAASLADNTSMSADEAKAILGAAAKETPEKRGNGSDFHNAMDRTQNPNVGGDNAGNGGDNNGGGETEADAANRILNTFTGATGRKVVPLRAS